jgi:hypothetical protein
MRGRPPKPIELHKLHGTYRPDRHGPKLSLPPKPPTPIVWAIAAFDDDGIPFVCDKCGESVDVELLNDGSWRRIHTETRESKC